MYEQQRFMDLPDKSGFDDPNSWITGEEDNPQAHQSQLAASSNGNLDRRLFNELVEMFPLVEHLIHQKEASSFTRRGSMVYTKKPSRETLSRRMPEPRGRNPSQSMSARKNKVIGGKDEGKNSNGDQESENAVHSSKVLAAEKDEFNALRRQVEDLTRKLSEKDELLKSLEVSKNQVQEVNAKLEQMKRLTAEKESLIKSMQLQLSDLKIKLADKQAALERIQWEAMTSSTKAEKLQEQVNSMQVEVSSFVRLLEGLANNDSGKSDGDYDVNPYQFDHVPYLDGLDETKMRKMEEAREAYMVAVAAAKERQDEESLAVAARARSYLQSLVLMS